MHFQLQSQLTHNSCLNRDQDQDPRDQNIVVVDGVPVLLPTYEEAVGSATPLPPQRIAPPVSLGDILQEEEPQPPEYPGHTETPSRAPLDTSECETYESFSDNSECVQSTQASSSNAGGMNNHSERTNVVSSIEETASTSPSVDIADGKYTATIFTAYLSYRQQFVSQAKLIHMCTSMNALFLMATFLNQFPAQINFVTLYI